MSIYSIYSASLLKLNDNFLLWALIHTVAYSQIGNQGLVKDNV